MAWRKRGKNRERSSLRGARFLWGGGTVSEGYGAGVRCWGTVLGYSFSGTDLKECFTEDGKRHELNFSLKMSTSVGEVHALGTSI